MKKKGRFEWVDIVRAVAIIFVYIGHWSTPKMEIFAYSFDLFLFFLISGFFARNHQKYKFLEFIKKEFLTLIVPIFIWSWIALIIQNFDDNTFSISRVLDLFISPISVKTNYWFIPAIFSCSVIYYLLLKVTSKKIKWVGSEYLICFVLLIIHFLYGETPLIKRDYNIFYIISGFPVINIIGNWFSIASLPQYLFWYSLGSITFDKINKILEFKSKKKIAFNAVGFCITFITSILLLKGVYNIGFINKFIHQNNFILCAYKIICALTIIGSVIYLSTYLENSEILKKIGRNTMSLMGIEFITHDLITLTLLPMINLGIPNVTSTIGVLILVFSQFAINLCAIKFINNHFPILNGKVKFKKTSAL